MSRNGALRNGFVNGSMYEGTGAAFGMGAVLGFWGYQVIPISAYLRCRMELGVCVRLKHGVQSTFDKEIGWYTCYV